MPEYQSFYNLILSYSYHWIHPSECCTLSFQFAAKDVAMQQFQLNTITRFTVDRFQRTVSLIAIVNRDTERESPSVQSASVDRRNLHNYSDDGFSSGMLLRYDLPAPQITRIVRSTTIPEITGIRCTVRWRRSSRLHRCEFFRDDRLSWSRPLALFSHSLDEFPSGRAHRFSSNSIYPRFTSVSRESPHVYATNLSVQSRRATRSPDSFVLRLQTLLVARCTLDYRRLWPLLVQRARDLHFDREISIIPSRVRLMVCW